MIPYDILHSYEKIPALIYKTSSEASEEIAKEIAQAIKSSDGKPFKLGLSTGTSPVQTYKFLVDMYDRGEVSFSNVSVFSIDEYAHYSGTQTRNRVLEEELLSKVDILPENIHILDKECPMDALAEHCAEFEEKSRNLDLLVMGVGETGQVGFNEAGSGWKSRTRTILLSYKSRKRQTNNFGGDINKVPISANTMGIGTFRSAKRIILMAWGEDKSQAVKDTVEGEPDPKCPASLLQRHENIVFYTDENSSELLTRVVAPWTVGPCEWTPRLVRQAVVWLCQLTGKPILKLTLQDYLENSLGNLLTSCGT